MGEEVKLRMNRCETCKFREQEVRFAGLPGAVTLYYCTNPKITEDWGDVRGDDCLIYDYCEGGGFQVGPKFGCVHHEKKD